jgi:hypothetical protein
VEWNLQVQQQLQPTTIFSLGYAGSKSTRLNYTGFANVAQHASNSATTTLAQVDALKHMPWMAPNWHYSIRHGLWELQRTAGRTPETILQLVQFDRVLYLVEVAGQQQRMVRGGEWHGWRFSSAKLF